MTEADGERSLGQRLDELLAPYLKDKAEIQSRLDREVGQRHKLDAQIQNTRRDLQIVEQSMVEALRSAAGKDPLLAAVFSVGDQTEASGLDTGGKSGRSNPLLHPAA